MHLELVLILRVNVKYEYIFTIHLVFRKVNLNEGRMKHVAKSWHVERPDLIGLDFLWDLYLALPSSDASLDGGHSNRPVDSETIMRSTSDIDNSTGNKPQLGSPSKQSTTTAILFSSLPASKPTPDAAKPARLLLLNVHWGQLAPKLRRDPESCYRRFFDTCRRRLEANYALGRGLITEYGVTSVLAETGELLAALMLGLGPATKAKHCSRTAAKLAIRRLLGLVYAFIQSVEDEMFGSRSYLPNWKPHGCTYRGWDMHLLVKIETVKQGQPHVSVTNLTTVGSQSVNKLSTSTSNILTDFYQHSDHIEPISLLAHSNEPLSSIRDRAYLASSAFLFASQSQPNYQQDSCLSPSWTVATLSLEEAPKPKVSFLNESRKPIKKTMFSHDTSGQHAENKSINREKPSQLLDTVLNRKPIGELGFQIGRHLVVRFYAEANPRSRSRVSTTSAVSSVTTTAPGLSSNSPYNSSFSLAGPYSSTLELTSEYLNNPTSLPNTYNLTSDESSRLLSSFRKRLEIPSFSSSFLTKGSSLLSLNAKQSVVELPADSNQAQPNSAHVSNVNIILPSVCLGQDSAVYELLFELAESELHHPSTSTSSGTYFSSTFGFIHPVRLLLACLPTYKSLRCERNGSGGMHLQYSLVCNPYTLLNSSPYRVLYKLQLLSSVLLPIDSSPWWETSPGCLLSPPSSAYFISYPSHSSTVSQAYKLLESVSVGSNLRSSSTGRRPSQSRVQPMNGDSKCDWFLSVDAINVNSQSSNSTSAPPSPILSSRRSLKVFSAFPRSTDVFSSKGKSQKNTPKDLSLVADAPLIEYIEALVQLLERNLIPFFPTSPHKIPNSTKKHNSPFPFVLRSCHTHRHFDASEGEFTISSEFHNTATDNTNWWRREVRHLCLQLIASLLNPVTSGSNDINSNRHFTTTVHNSRKGSITPEQISVLPSDSLVYQISSSLASSLLNALLETALVSAGIDVELLDHTLTKQQPYLSTTSVQSMNRLNTFLSHVDSRSGVAGIIEAISYFGRKVLFQDVEISVQCIRLYFQCIIAYPSTFVDVLLKSVNLEDKFIKLLVYSPSERVRGEMARQLEQLCILVSPYLYTGSTCFLVPNSSQCSLHSFVRNPEILNLILKAILHTSLPFSDVKLDIMSSSTANILISQCAEYFRVRGFLLGQTPVRILKENFNTDHITILQNDLSWFRKMMDFDNDLLSYQIIISDCLLAGHLDSVRLFCAQLVASVSSHFMCTFSDNGSSAFLSVMDKPASGLNHSNFSRNESTTDSQLLPSVKLLEALAKPSVLTTNLYEGNKCQSTLNNEFTKTMIPIHSSAALKIATECLYLSRDFIYYLVVECLFPAARYLLSDQATKELLLNAPTSSSSQKFSKREHLRRTLSALSKHCNLPQLDAFKSALPLTKKAALSFLSFVCRIDCQSLEKLVNLLILLHHSHKPDEIGPKLDTSSITMPGSICSSEITDRNSNKNTTEEFSNPQKASSIPQNMTGKADVHWDVQPIVVGRAECGFVGLRNGGATCYMNSVLQQLFMQPGVAETLLAVTDTDDTDEKNILFQTQRLFGHLLQSQREYFDPVGFWKSFRPWSTNVEINPFEQQDAFDFFQALIDQLDDGLKKMKRAPFFQALYQGIFLDSKFCDECDHRYDREEVFSAINLAVKANDLHEALNQFVRGEVLEGDNAYYCERCCVKRRAVKRLSIHTLPPVLCLHLKRFDFDWDRQIPTIGYESLLTGSIQKFRSAAFFSPHSSTSALLQRAAKEDIPSPDPDNSKTNDDEKSNVDVNKSTERNVDIENPVTFSNSPPSSPTSSRSGIYSFLEMPSADNIEETEVEKNDALKATISPNIPLSSYKKPSNNEATDNIYKLVGVVVHSGQANSGHYYSFIKDRRSKTLSRPPIIFQNNEQVTASTNNQNTSIIYQSPDHSVQSFETSQLETISENQSQMERLRTHHTTNNLKDSVENWYRFNDTCVEPVELTDDLLEHECFGGTYKVIGNDGKSVETRTRYWSAYLLFYERIDIHCSVYKQPETVSDSLSNQQTDLQIEEHRDERNLDPDLSHNDQSQAGIKSNKQRSENSSSIMTTSTTINKTKSVLMPTPIAQQIWTENMIFLRDQNVYSYEYFKFVRDLCEGILTDVGSLRQEPERGVLGTKLISHFLFNTFLCLHPRVKLSMALNSSELVTSLSATTVSEISTKLNSDLLGLLTRLATTNPNAARCLMHFLYVSPNQPCLVSMLLDPKPVARQQSANMILTVLQAFYSFKETNILDGALTGLINYLLGLFDNGQIVEHLTEAGALFAMLRGYAEMCPHATVHLSNLKATKRLLNFFIEPNPPSSFSPNETPVCYPSFTGNAPDWTHKLRVWSPAQHREMGNLYYLLTIMLRQTSFDAYRIPDTSSVHDAAPHPSLAHRQSSQSRLLLRPQKETVLWLGLSMPPLTNHILELSSTTNRYSTQLVGLFRLCEVLLKAYLENPVIPSLTSSLGLGDGLSYTSSVTSGGGASTTSLSNTANSAGPCPTTAFSELPIVMGGEPVTLRQRIRELMVHISANSWDASQCFIIALLDRIHSRPQSSISQSNEVIAHRGDEEISEHGPPQVVGLLDLIHADYSQDPRRAYQCTKFIVELSTQNTAVVKYLSHFQRNGNPL
ncbi:unnamed protein product [Heterobilharzia americana]|nr:unnamed protein product [Heterobilharzia americana]